MLSKEIRKYFFQKFSIKESMINRPIHYKIPENTGINTYLIYNNFNEQRLHKKISGISRNRTNYSKSKENNIRKIKNNIERTKLDILFSKTYDKINNKKNYTIIPNRKLEIITKQNKETIKDDITHKNNFYNNLFKKRLYRNNDNYFLDKQYTWSKTFLEQKKIKDYKNFYKIKYIDTIPSFQRKIYDPHKYQRDKTIPKIIKLNSPEHSYKSNLFYKRKNIFQKKKLIKDNYGNKMNTINFNHKFNC